MKKINKVLAFALCIIMLLFIGGCGAKDANDYLAKADYAKAYDVSKTNEEKTVVKAEYTFSYLCERCKIDAFDGEKIDFNLQSAWFANGENLADSLAGYKYYLMKINFDTTKTAYILYNYDDADSALNNMFNTLSLEEESGDDAFSGFKKEICKYIMDSAESYMLKSESLDRINTFITNDSLKNIELSNDLFLIN